MTVDELGQMVKDKHPEYSQYSSTEIGNRIASKYPEYRVQISQFPQGQTNAENMEPGIYGETDPTGQKFIENLNRAGMGYGAGALGGGLVSGGISGVSKLVGKIKDIRNAPQTLSDTLGSAIDKFGTAETPSMVGNTARTAQDAEASANKDLADKLYGQVQDVNVPTPRLSATYQKMADELPPSIGNAIKKNIQTEANPIRPNDIGTTNTPNQYLASPGTPSQLPPNEPPIAELIKLRSKLGAASRSGGVDGYNAGQLKAALDADIENIGADQGPLGKMTNEVTNEPFKRATSYYRDLMGQQGTPLYRKLATGKVEDIPDIIFKSGRTADANEARAILGDAGFAPAKKSFFNDLINSKDVGKVLDKYSSNNSDFLSSVFNSNELNSLKTVADLQQKAIDAENMVERAKMLMTGAIGGGIAVKALKFGADASGK